MYFLQHAFFTQNLTLSSSTLLCVTVTNFFSLLYGVRLSDYTTVYLFILIWVDTWTVSMF
jgi:hypothetical protein